MIHAESHIEHLASHKALVVDGELVFEPIENAMNNTPLWVIHVGADIVPDHSNFTFPALYQLIDLIQNRTDLFATSTQTWIYSQNPDDNE